MGSREANDHGCVRSDSKKSELPKYKVVQTKPEKEGSCKAGKDYGAGDFIFYFSRVLENDCNALEGVVKRPRCKQSHSVQDEHFDRYPVAGWKVFHSIAQSKYSIVGDTKGYTQESNRTSD